MNDKKQFAQDWLQTIKAEMYKREFILAFKETKKDTKQADLDALKENNKLDGEMATFLEEWLKNN